MKFADLHIHSIFSDGTFDINQILSLCKSKGLSCIAICDHDTVGGVEIALNLASKFEMEVIPCVELTCEYQSREIHLLGYFVDYKDEQFLKIIDELQEYRKQRVFHIVEKLNKLGVNIQSQEIFDQNPFPNISWGRLHIANTLVRKGVVSSYKEAFRKFIGEKGPAYVSRFKFSPFRGIQILKEAKALPVLAHPLKSKCEDLIPELIEAGLEGIEVFYPQHPLHIQNYYIQIAHKYGVLITGGSDCHGFAKKEVFIGRVKLPYSYVEKMKNRYAEIFS